MDYYSVPDNCYHFNADAIETPEDLRDWHHLLNPDSLTSTAYLGWISHDSEESFLASEECEELKETALDQLVYNIEQAATLYDHLTKGAQQQ